MVTAHMVVPSQALNRSYSMTDAPRHAFTDRIYEILAQYFGDAAPEIFAQSPLLGYINHKTKSANRGSKS